MRFSRASINGDRVPSRRNDKSTGGGFTLAASITRRASARVSGDDDGSSGGSFTKISDSPARENLLGSLRAVNTPTSGELTGYEYSTSEESAESDDPDVDGVSV